MAIRTRRGGGEAVTIRPPRDDEREALAALESNAFRSDMDAARRRASEADLGNILCLFEGDRLASSLKIHPFRAFVGGRKVGLGGIGAVMTFADCQGRGHAGRLLAHSLRDMRRRGQALAELYPFSHVYYGRHGYGRAAEHFHFPNLTQRDLPAFEERHMVRRLDPGEGLAPLLRAHSRIIRRYNLCCERTTDGWRKFMDRREERKTFCYVIRDGGEVIGWFACSNQRRNSTGGHESTTQSMALSGRRALRAMLGFHAKLPDAVKHISLHLPSDMDLWDETGEPAEKIIRPDQQLRIVDLEAALRLRGYQAGAEGRLVLRIADRDAPWNRGTWAVRWRDGTLASMDRTNRPSDLAADIAAFAQLYCGYKSADELANANRLKLASPRSAALLDALFHDRPTNTQDWF